MNTREEQKIDGSDAATREWFVTQEFTDNENIDSHYSAKCQSVTERARSALGKGRWTDPDSCVQVLRKRYERTFKTEFGLYFPVLCKGEIEFK